MSFVNNNTFDTKQASKLSKVNGRMTPISETFSIESDRIGQYFIHNFRSKLV